MFQSKVVLSVAALVLIITLIAGCAPAAQTGTSSNGPIVIGWVGNTSSPGVKPSIEVTQMAIDEINASGGVLGRPLKMVVEDGKGEANLTMAAIQRMIMGNKVPLYFLEARTELAMPAKEKSADLQAQYPHLLFCGSADYEATMDMVAEYDRYKFFFRNYEFAQYPWYYNINMKMMRDTIKAKKIALLYEDLMWTRVYRQGSKVLGMPAMKQYAEEKWGLQVVYEAAVKSRSGMWLPTLEAIAKSGAEAIFILSSWYTDTEVLTKQWADSSAKDSQLILMGGINQSHVFWDLTGGKCLGVITNLWEDDTTAITPQFIPFIKKCMAKNIPVQYSVVASYSDTYFIKTAIEKASGADDIGKLITTVENHEYDAVAGKYAFWNVKKDPWLHSLKVTNPDNLIEYIYPTSHTPFTQIQGQAYDKYVMLQTQEGEMQKKFAHPELYKKPSELRAAVAAK